MKKQIKKLKFKIYNMVNNIINKKAKRWNWIERKCILAEEALMDNNVDSNYKYRNDL